MDKKQKAIELLKECQLDYEKLTDDELYNLKQGYLYYVDELKKANKENRKALVVNAARCIGIFVFPALACTLISKQTLPTSIAIGFTAGITAFVQVRNLKKTKELREDAKVVKEIYKATKTLGLELSPEKEKEIDKKRLEETVYEFAINKLDEDGNIIGQEMYRAYGNGEIEDISVFSEFMTNEDRVVDFETMKKEYKKNLEELTRDTK